VEERRGLGEVAQTAGEVQAPERGRWLAQTLLAMTDTLVEEFDLGTHLDQLAGSIAYLLDGWPVGVAVVGESPSDPWTVGGSGPSARSLVEKEEVTGAGPATEAMRNGRQVAASATTDRGGRWAGLVPGFQELHLAGVHALPLRHRDQVLGAVVIYRLGELPPDAVHEAVATLADGAAIGVAQARNTARAQRLAAQLQRALSSRIAIEQAKGVLSERLAVPVEDAFSLMRRHARNHRVRLDAVARDVVQGAVPASERRAAS
jgi:GAF domain-containing protein